ncbi:hypothetical protein V1522DRAFT_97435 [Lipomyces starkeyi]
MVTASGFSNDMVQQLEKAMEIFERSHPGCIGLFCFDQSSNHQALPPDAPVVRQLTLKDKKVEEYIKSGYFELKGLRYNQDICYPEGQAQFGWQKGMRTILQERQPWDDGLPRLCQRKAAEIHLSQPTQLDICSPCIQSFIVNAILSSGSGYTRKDKRERSATIPSRRLNPDEYDDDVKQWIDAARDSGAVASPVQINTAIRKLLDGGMDRVRHFARLAWC